MIHNILQVLLLLSILAIPIMLGLTVYRDAKMQKMDALFWTFIALAVPMFMGLLIYLVVRSTMNPLKCSSCDRGVLDEFILCPYCGKKLKYTCKYCNQILENDWNTCAKCGNKRPSQNSLIVKPETKQLKRLWVLLVIVTFMPFIILFIMALRANGILP